MFSALFSRFFFTGVPFFELILSGRTSLILVLIRMRWIFREAKSILKEGAPTIQIGYDKLPSRYPPGYPILMIAWLSFLPHNGILAPFRTNQTIGALLLTGSFIFYFAIGRPLAGGLAALLIATQPAFITFSRSSISDLSGGAVIVLAFALVYLGLAWRRRLLIYCAAIVLGLSLCIRPQLVSWLPY